MLRVVDPPKDQDVDGLKMALVPHSKEDWYFNFGGVYGDVELACVPAVRIADVFVQADSTGQTTVNVEFRNDTDSPVELTYYVAIVGQLEVDSGAALPHQAYVAPPGRSTETVKLKVGTPLAPRTWTPDSPTMYQCIAGISKGASMSVKQVAFGFRDFTVKDGQFVLNGQPILLKGVLYQPYYPLGLARPVDKDYLRQEVQRMKDANINLLRAHVRAAPPELLDVCDELGMLVMAEPSIGWIPSLDDGGDWAKYVQKGGQPEELRKLCLGQIEGLVARDRNHPSIVWWGMLNEGSGVVGRDYKQADKVVFNIKNEMMQAAGKLDPTRLITDDSAGWSNEWYKGHHAGHYMLPGQSDSHVYTDDHVYEMNIYDYAKFGNPADLVFVSEFGHGGMDDFPATLKAFGNKTYAEDYKQYADQAQAVERASRQAGLKMTLTEVVAAFQAAQARDVRRRTEMLRLSPGVDGYCLTQWQETSPGKAPPGW